MVAVVRLFSGLALLALLPATVVAAGNERIEALAPLKEVMARELAAAELPSISVTVIQDGEVVFDEAIGLADREKGVAATTDTPYSLASVSKIFTGVATMALAERGKLDLDTPINQYLGDAKVRVHLGEPGDVTVRRVLNHTAGLPLHYHFFYSDREARRPPMDESIRKFGHVVIPPGERFSYSNFGYGLLDYLIERRSGESYGEFLHSNFFAPLDMLNSATVTEVGSLRGVAVPYGGHNQPVATYDFDHRGASAVFASTRDLARFGAWFLGQLSPETGQLPGPEARREMVAVDPAPNRDGQSTYGLGINVRRAGGDLIYSHSGNMPGVSATLTMWPERGAALAVAINSSVDGSLASLGRIVDSTGALLKGINLPEAAPVGPGPSSKPPQPMNNVPKELVGTWQGEITTDQAVVPLQLSLSADGTMVASVAGGEPQPVKPYGVDNGMYRLALPTVQIPTKEAQQYMHGTLLQVVPRGEHLSGSATAFGAPGVFPMGSALSYWVDLVRQPGATQ